MTKCLPFTGHSCTLNIKMSQDCRCFSALCLLGRLTASEDPPRDIFGVKRPASGNICHFLQRSGRSARRSVGCTEAWKQTWFEPVVPAPYSAVTQQLSTRFTRTTECVAMNAFKIECPKGVSCHPHLRASSCLARLPDCGLLTPPLSGNTQMGYKDLCLRSWSEVAQPRLSEAPLRPSHTKSVFFYFNSILFSLFLLWHHLGLLISVVRQATMGCIHLFQDLSLSVHPRYHGNN